LRLIPALRNTLFLRYGSVHRNTYIQSPAVLNESLQLKKNGNIFFAGQITGVEGYVESTAMGFVAGLSAHAYSRGKIFIPPPQDTSVGELLRYITTETKNFQPMNVNFGLFKDYRKREKEKVVRRALESITLWKTIIDEEMY
jgi:methylenetetrahydrofolate--tRNA-(uracil-5-)-methyltransferase